MKMRFLLFSFCLSVASLMNAQVVYKVDINEFSRNNMDEVLETDFTPWKFRKDVMADTLTVDGVTFVIRADHLLRAGWNKAFVQSKVFNCRLTGDGANLEPNECGAFDLVIRGLQPGQHTIQTFHSSWQDPAKTVGWPITLRLNGQVTARAATRTMQEPSMQDATVLVTTFNVNQADDEVVLTFETSEQDPPQSTEGKTVMDRTPILNGFMIDAIQSAAQARRPAPADADMHVDADDGTYLMHWAAANQQIAAHRLYFGTDSVSVAEAVAPTYEGTDTTWMATGLDNLHVYYWRVDEVDADGTVTRGDPWKFRPRHLAFPGAEGYGRYANGGRGGSVYHVTNLNDDRLPGSFRYGMECIPEPHTIVFDVSGIIHLGGTLRAANAMITVAGQTAPGKGICFSGAAMGFNSDQVIRFIRNRVGSGPTYDGMGFRSARESIMDHCSISWSIDEGFSSREAGNITLQRTLISEALNVADHDKYDEGSRHGFAAVFGGDIGSFHHNLLANNSGRNPRLDGGMDGNGFYMGRLDIFNNVVYNWNSHPAYGESHEANFHRNFYKMGPATTRKWILRADVNQRGSNKGTESYYYMYNVLVDKNDRVIFDGIKHGDGSTTNVDGGLWQLVNPMTVDWNPWVDEPFYPSYATVHTAYDAYKNVLSDVGCTQPMLDNHDQRQIDETKTGTNKYKGSKTGLAGLPDTEEDVGGYEVYPEERRADDYDTDQDGMPNWWEPLAGSNPDVADHNSDPDLDGYTLLEDYLDFIAHPYVVLAPDATTTVNVAPYFRGFTKSPSYDLDVNTDLLTVVMADSIANMTAKGQTGCATLVMRVTDSEGSTYQQRLGVAVTTGASAIISPSTEDLLMASYEVYTLDGKLVDSGRGDGLNARQLPLTHLPANVYVLKTTDSSGGSHSFKIIK